MKHQTISFNGHQPPILLLLFADERPGSTEQINLICQYLEVQQNYPFELQVINAKHQPDLAECYKVIATPALIKTQPDPRHTLIGSDLLSQLKNWWPKWQKSAIDYYASIGYSPPNNGLNSFADSAEIIKLKDELFQLQQEQAELKEKLVFKDRVISLLAHELRNPLTGASMALETLEYDQLKNHPNNPFTSLQSHLIKQARAQLRLMGSLITDILQAALGNNREIIIKFNKLDLRILVLEIIDYFQDRFVTKCQDLEQDIPQDLPLVYGDRDRLRQVLINLVENAIKYTPQGGRIKISILHRTIQTVQLSIADTGPGIPPENQERIFQANYRLKRDQDQEGYGLGLSFCQKVITSHYGRIWVESRIGEGSCFNFTLPTYSN